MTVARYCDQHGLIATLKKLGQHDLASKLELRQKLQEQALQEEGPDVPFEQRKNAKLIAELDQYYSQGWEYINDRAKKKYDCSCIRKYIRADQNPS